MTLPERFEGTEGCGAVRTVVLVSGGGTNLQALIEARDAGALPQCELSGVISSKSGAYALERATAAGIPSACVSRRRFAGSVEYDAALLEGIRGFRAELVVLAGFLSILGHSVVQAYAGRIINIHPALIPSFCGKGFYGLAPHAKALERGVRVTGATTHFVTEEADAGPIILQRAVAVEPGDTPESLQLRVMEEAERPIIVESVRLFCQGRLRIENGRVIVLPERQARDLRAKTGGSGGNAVPAKR